MTSLSTKLSVALALSLAGANAFAQSGSGSRGDGYTLLGQFSQNGQPIEVPQFSAAQIQEELKKLRATKPDESIQYENLFDPGDQAAFDELQLQLAVRIDNSVRSIAKVKQLFTEGLVVYQHFADEGGSKAEKRNLGSIAETYRSIMREEYDKVLNSMNPSSTITSQPRLQYTQDYRGQTGTDQKYLYKKDAQGRIVAIGTISYSVTIENGKWTYGPIGLVSTILGVVDVTGCTMTQQGITGCDWKAGEGTLLDVARRCRTNVCVHEIGKVAQELLENSISLQEKVKFENSTVNDLSFYFTPKHSMLRRALANYIDDKTANKETNAAVVAILGLTNIAYMPTMTLIDAIANFQMLKTTFNFRPTVWSDGYSRRHAASGLMGQFTQIAAERLRSQLGGR